MYMHDVFKDPVRVGEHKSMKLSQTDVPTEAGGLIEIEADEAGNVLAEPTPLTGKTFDPTATIPEFNLNTMIEGVNVPSGVKKSSKIISSSVPPPPPPDAGDDGPRNLPPPPPMSACSCCLVRIN